MTHHIKHVSSKEMDINEVTILTSEELKAIPIKTDNKIISGFRKDHHNIIMVSQCYNKTRDVPTLDLRTFVEDKDTKDYVPTKRGFRLDPGAFAVLLNMLRECSYLVLGPLGPDREHETTEQSNHLHEQNVDNMYTQNPGLYEEQMAERE